MRPPRVPVITLLVTLLTQALPTPVHAFFADTDVSWYREDIDELVKKGIVRGYSDGTFKPRQAVNRAEFIKTLLQNDRSLTTPERRCFPDVAVDEWYAPYVCTAKERGIVQGQRGGLFQPESEINTAEALKMLLLARKERIDESGASPWYKPYVKRADELGIAGAYAALPWERMTRERMAGMLLRSLRQEETGRPGNLSPGCYRSAPDTDISSIQVSGATREFILSVPREYSPREPHPLVVAFHGRTNSNEAVRDYYRIEQTGLNAIVVYPAGLRRQDGTYSWSEAGDKPGQLRDMRFFRELARMLMHEYCVDVDRVFVVGHSLGGWFTNSLGCAYGGIIRATATVAGQPASGACASPAAGLFLHDPKDTLVRFADGERSRDQRALQNGCASPVQMAPVAPASLHCREVSACVSGQSVVWCAHDEGGANGHQWPRDTGRIIADFFRDLP